MVSSVNGNMITANRISVAKAAPNTLLTDVLWSHSARQFFIAITCKKWIKWKHNTDFCLHIQLPRCAAKWNVRKLGATLSWVVTYQLRPLCSIKNVQLINWIKVRGSWWRKYFLPMPDIERGPSNPLPYLWNVHGLMEASMKLLVFWDMELRSLVEVARPTIQTCVLPLSRRLIACIWNVVLLKRDYTALLSQKFVIFITILVLQSWRDRSTQRCVKPVNWFPIRRQGRDRN